MSYEWSTLELSVKTSRIVPIYLCFTVSPSQVVMDTCSDEKRPTKRSLWLHIMQVAELPMMKLMPSVSKEKWGLELADVARAVCVCDAAQLMVKERHDYLPEYPIQGLENGYHKAT